MNHTFTFASALLLSAAPALAQSAKSDDAKAKAKAEAAAKGKMTVVDSESMDGGDSKTIELRIDNGEVTVKRNGKEVPKDQIRREADGRIIILDENGDELDGVSLFQGLGEGGRFFTGENGLHGFQFRHGVDGEGNGFWLGGDQEGPAPKVMLGVHMTEPGAALEKHLKLKPGKCVMITGVFEGLPAEVAGIGEFDVIVRIDDSDEADAGTIRKILADKGAGDTVTVRVIQAGEAKDLKLKLQEYDAKKLGSARLIGKEPGANAWTSLNAFGEGNVIDLEGLKGLESLPQLRNRVFVAPGEGADQWRTLLPQLRAMEGGGNMAELQPQINEALKNALKNYEGAIKLHQGDLGGGDGGVDVESQLDRLDKRMAQLEELLGKLLEKQAKP